MKNLKKTKLSKHEIKYWHIPKEVVKSFGFFIPSFFLAIISGWWTIQLIQTDQLYSGDFTFIIVVFVVSTLFAFGSMFILLVEWSLANEKLELHKEGKKEVWVKEHSKLVKKKVIVPGHFKIVKIRK